MTDLRFTALPTNHVRALQAGAADANGQTPERHISDGAGNPCRHCLADIAAGEPYLILAYRPFPSAQPYAETGPIFLHADGCPRHTEAAEVPAIFHGVDHLIVRGYGVGDRIVYGTGQVVPIGQLSEAAATTLDRPEVAYLHVRSATNNCFQCRIDRG